MSTDQTPPADDFEGRVASEWSLAEPLGTPLPPARRRRLARALPVAMAAGVLATTGAGVAIGHLAWGSSPGAVSAAKVRQGNSVLPSSPALPDYGGNSGSVSGAGSAASGSPANAAAIANSVDPGLVDINTTIDYGSAEAAGTGMVLTADGEVLTNNHVIEGATKISVIDIGNGKTYQAKVLGYDRSHDIAVLQLQGASGLTTVKTGDSSVVQANDGVVAVGNAGGVGGTPSYAGGSVTAVDQSITASDEGTGTSEQLQGLFTTNADIQPGDSGGPLVDSSGQVIGIDTAGSASSGFTFGGTSSSTSQGFAIPINTALNIARKIKSGTATSTVHIGATAFLGVQIGGSTNTGNGNGGLGSGFGGFGSGGINPGINGFGGAQSNSGTGTGATPAGATISGVVSKSPAATAGLTGGDTITSVNGQVVSSSDALSTVMTRQKPGKSVSVSYVDANGQAHTATVTLAAGPPQ